ncbi:MAG: M20/M25/M40 family metallo-hydrolase [Oscillospiraceae bacterium]|nr:M20/M25/M40 family metallo-hydrolase [Oscillospiraceae bacterium]
MLDILERLCAIPGVSGWEDAVCEEIIRLIKGHCEYETDALGNLIAYKKGRQKPGNTVLFSAHMDEVGLIITMIEDSGLLRFAAVGGIDPRTIAGKAVELGGAKIPGVIGRKPIHLQKPDERDAAPTADKLYIDIGAKDKSEAEQHIRVGGRAVFSSKFRRVGEGKIIGRAFDDRAGCAVLIDLIQSELAHDCVFSFTVQEETGCTGARTAAYRVKPDIAIAVETTTAADIEGVPVDKKFCELGKGPVISFMDKGTVYDRGLYDKALDIAKTRGIPCQVKRGVAGGNESRSLQTAGGGSRVMAVSLPCRYLHTPSNMLCTSDLANTRALLFALAEELL